MKMAITLVNVMFKVYNPVFHQWGWKTMFCNKNPFLRYFNLSKCTNGNRNKGIVGS